MTKYLSPANMNFLVMVFKPPLGRCHNAPWGLVDLVAPPPSLGETARTALLLHTFCMKIHNTPHPLPLGISGHFYHTVVHFARTHCPLPPPYHYQAAGVLFCCNRAIHACPNSAWDASKHCYARFLQRAGRRVLMASQTSLSSCEQAERSRGEGVPPPPASSCPYMVPPHLSYLTDLTQFWPPPTPACCLPCPLGCPSSGGTS